MQLPLWHSFPTEHAFPFPSSAPHPPLPLQLIAPAHSFAGSVPFGMFVHVPSEPGTLHAMHVPEHALLQQNPSTQSPSAHSFAAAQACPFDFLHAPVPSQTWATPAHSSIGSCPAAIGEHVPTSPGRLHAWHVPAHALLQHTPSTQFPPAH